MLLWHGHRRLDFAQAVFTSPPWNASTHSEYSYYVNTEWQPPRRTLRTLQPGALRAVLWSAAIIALAAVLLSLLGLKASTRMSKLLMVVHSVARRGRSHARGEGHYAGQTSTP